MKHAGSLPGVLRRQDAPALELPDPSKAEGSEEQQLEVYRQVRDAIRERIDRELLKDVPVGQEREP